MVEISLKFGGRLLLEKQFAQYSACHFLPRGRYYVFDEKSNTMQEQTMANSYPKLSTSPHDENVKVFTFQFAKSKKVFYDPINYDPPLYSSISGETKIFKERKRGVNLNTKIATWICSIITGTAGLAALFGEIGEKGNESIAQIGASFQTISEKISKKKIVQDGTLVAIDIYGIEKSSKAHAVGFGYLNRSRKVVGSAYEIIPSNSAGKDELEKLMNGKLSDDIKSFYSKNNMSARTNNSLLRTAAETQKLLRERLEIIEIEKANAALEDEIFEKETAMQAPQTNVNCIVQETVPQAGVDKATARLKDMIVGLLVLLAIVILLFVRFPNPNNGKILENTAPPSLLHNIPEKEEPKLENGKNTNGEEEPLQKLLSVIFEPTTAFRAFLGYF